MDDTEVSPTHTQVSINFASKHLDLTVALLRQLADLHARLETVEEKLGGKEGSGREQE